MGSYFRPPSFGELYGSIGLINGNPELLPEEGFNVDVGFHYSASALELSGTLFASIRDELIVTSFDSRGVGRPCQFWLGGSCRSGIRSRLADFS